MGRSVCWKCRYLVENPGGFFKRKKKHGPCDRCLGQMTAFQVADETRIWIKFIPPKEKKSKEEQKKEDRKER